MIDGILDSVAADAEALLVGEPEPAYGAMTERDLGREIKRLEKQMRDFARDLRFEDAARVRDRLARLRERAFVSADGPDREEAISGT